MSAYLVSEKPNVESIMTSTERDKYEAREQIVSFLSAFSGFSSGPVLKLATASIAA